MQSCGGPYIMVTNLEIKSQVTWHNDTELRILALTKSIENRASHRPN